MFQRVKNFFSNEYSKAQTKGGRPKRKSVSSVAGKLLVIFFITMLVFTIVSRATASLTVARVSVSSPKRDRLLYSITGIGEIVPSGEKRIQVEPGYRIEEVYVSAGEGISTDMALFKYNMENLQDKYDSLQNEINKINIQISQEKLRLQSVDNISAKTGLLSVKQAEENLEVANNNLAEVEKDYDDNINKMKEKQDEDWQKEYERRQKEYKTALKNYDSVLLSQERQLKLSGRALDDAKAVLLQTNEKYGNINPLIDDYIKAVKEKNEDKINQAEEVIFEAYYGGKDSYEDHKDAVFNSAVSIRQDDYYIKYMWNSLLQYEEQLYTALNNLNNAKNKVNQADNTENVYKDLEEKYLKAWKDYSLIKGEYERQLDILEDGLESESLELKRLRRNDKKLKEYLARLRKALEQEAETEDIRKELFDFVLGDKAEAINKEIMNASLAVTRAEEDYELLVKEFDMVRSNLQLELTELNDAIISMEKETFDYSDNLEAKRQAVKSAKEAVRLAKQGLESARLQYEAANNPDNNQATDQMIELTIQSYNIDLHKKEEELQKVGKLIEASGEVFSPVDGVITHVGIEAGRSTTGEETVKIGAGEYVFKGSFIRDENVIIELGGNVDITLPGGNAPIESGIGKISVNPDGTTEFISSLPQGEYYFGEKADFKISTESEMYDQCIPIQALRQDNYGYYVLVISEKEDILGTQLIAERINVDLLAKGNTIVAVNGFLSKSQIITDSNKYINAGDRVRIE